MSLGGDYQRLGVKTWLLISIVSELIPVGALWLAAHSHGEPFPYRELFGYSFLLLIALTLLFAICADVLLDGPPPPESLLFGVISGTLVVGIVVSAVDAEFRSRVAEKCDCAKEHAELAEVNIQVDLLQKKLNRIYEAFDVPQLPAAARGQAIVSDVPKTPDGQYITIQFAVAAQAIFLCAYEKHRLLGKRPKEPLS